MVDSRYMPYLPQWSAQTWFDFFLVIATCVEATALVFMYRLERTIETARSGVRLIARIQVPHPEGWAYPTFWIVNGSESGCYIEQVLLSIQLLDFKRNSQHALMDGPGVVLRPFAPPL